MLIPERNDLMQTAPDPDLYWISGSPPSWRVMLALTLKRVPYASHRLDAGKGENQAPAYLRINPTGQVPTLVHGTVTVRESVAILAHLDSAFPQRPIFGSTPAEAAVIWQAIMVFENRLAPAANTVARSLFRGTTDEDEGGFVSAVENHLEGLDEIEASLSSRDFLTGPAPSTVDIWLFPLLGWIDRAVKITADPVPNRLSRWSGARPELAAWRGRFAQWPGVAATRPPHWHTMKTTSH